MYRVFQVVMNYFEYRRQVQSGIKFMRGFNYIADLMDIAECQKINKIGFDWGIIWQRKFGVQLPPIIGCCFFGHPLSIITSSDLLQELYVRKNAHLTKHEMGMGPWSMIMKQAVFFEQTKSP